MSGTLRVAVGLGMIILWSRTASPDSPPFTPKDLAVQAQTILVLEFQKVAGDGGKAVAKVTRVIKGEFAPKEITIDLEASPLSEVAGKKLKEYIEKGQRQGLLFVGDTLDDGGMETGQQGYLHLAGEFTDNHQNEWFALDNVEGKPAEWDLAKVSSNMLGCFNGGTDMLLRCVDYVLADESADVPVYSGVTWAPEVLVAKVNGKVYGAKAIDLTGRNANGRADLFLAADSGDRLFRFADGMMADITEPCKLTSKSRLFAWGDFDGNGTPDLASYDGKGLTVHSQQADGTFVGRACDTGDALADVTELSTVDVGNKGRPALVATGKGYPLLLTIGLDGKGSARSLAAGEFPEKDVGVPGHSLVADFDGDGVADIVLLCSKAGLFYKGKSPGEFAEAVVTQAACGEDRSVVCLGDFDADGLPDILVRRAETDSDSLRKTMGRLLQNMGEGKFINMIAASGEIFYHPRTGAVAVDSGDFNNDGRADVLIAYGIEQTPHLLFNRGFRSFAHAYMVDLDQLNKLLPARQGQQAGCLGDFTGDGALDMLLVLKKDGEVWLFPRKVDHWMPSTAVVAALPPGGDSAGPVNVCAWTGTRPMGAQVVRAGEPGAFYGTRLPGPVVLKWKTPDGKEHEKTVVVEKGPVRVTLDEGK